VPYAGFSAKSARVARHLDFARTIRSLRHPRRIPREEKICSSVHCEQPVASYKEPDEGVIGRDIKFQKVSYFLKKDFVSRRILKHI
jgi:hypothetical protein